MICRGIGGFVISQPFVARADQQFFRDAFPERITLSSSSSSVSRPRDLVFVVNPRGANGRTATEWMNLFPFLKSRLGADYNIREAFTSGSAHAIDITREAIREGVNAVIAVGGDGTLHGVVNGFFSDGKPLRRLHKKDTSLPAIGLIPLGTGSDFSRTFGWKNDPHEAVDRLVKGVKSTIDVGVITGKVGEIRCFINVADIHLSAKAGYYSSRYKSFGNLCYIIGALKAFTTHHNQDLRIKVDEGRWEIVPNVTALCIGNGKFFGGGMKIAPCAEPHDGYLEVVILQNFKWHDFVFKLSKLYRGTHILDPNVTSIRVRSIEVEEVGGKGGAYVQCDGEHLGFLPIKFNVIPAALDMIC